MAKGLQKNDEEWVRWGRMSSVNFMAGLLVFLLVSIAPSMVGYFIYSCDRFKCDLVTPAADIFENGFGNVLQWLHEELWTKFTWQPVAGTLGFIVLQGLLYAFLPEPVRDGDMTPDGRVLKYKVGGIYQWLITVTLFLGGIAVYGEPVARFFYTYRTPIFAIFNVYGFVVSTGLLGFAYLQGQTQGKDRVFSGNLAYDFVMGVDLHPRIGTLFDLKLFHNARLGMLLWALVNMSYLFEQYYQLGFVTPGMYIVNFLQLLYVLDFFWLEEWYLKTIDVALDHFGWYLCWGIMCWLPFMYTLQARYLVENPTLGTMDWGMGAVWLVVGTLGLGSFRIVNGQRWEFRQTKGQCLINGKPAKYLVANYITGNGTKHQSLLLYSGFYGIARHFNYFCDLVQTLVMCLPCGINHFMPYMYMFQMVCLLVHRSRRDDHKCENKYGKAWQEYCRLVPASILPGVY